MKYLPLGLHIPMAAFFLLLEGLASESFDIMEEGLLNFNGDMASFLGVLRGLWAFSWSSLRGDLRGLPKSRFFRGDFTGPSITSRFRGDLTGLFIPFKGDLADLSITRHFSGDLTGLLILKGFDGDLDGLWRLEIKQQIFFLGLAILIILEDLRGLFDPTF